MNRKWVVALVFWTLLHVTLLVGGYGMRGRYSGNPFISEPNAIEEWFPASPQTIGAYDVTELLVYVGLPWAVLWARWYLRKVNAAK